MKAGAGEEDSMLDLRNTPISGRKNRRTLVLAQGSRKTTTLWSEEGEIHLISL
jgi:hypothetical protein